MRLRGPATVVVSVFLPWVAFSACGSDDPSRSPEGSRDASLDRVTDHQSEPNPDHSVSPDSGSPDGADRDASFEADASAPLDGATEAEPDASTPLDGATEAEPDASTPLDDGGGDASDAELDATGDGPIVVGCIPQEVSTR